MNVNLGKKLEFDPQWRGPLEKRSCTDLFCLLIFAVFVFCWAGIGYFALTHGDVKKLMVPTDSEGRKCGIDSDVQKKPYLLFFDLTKCISASTTCNTPQVCLEKCPSEDFVYIKNMGTIDEMKKKLICEMDVDLSSSLTWDHLDILISNQKCARWYLNSTSITRRCVPLKPKEAISNIEISVTQEKLNLAKKAIEVLAQIERVLKNIYDDLEKTKYEIPIFILGSGLITITYILLLRWFTTPFVCLSIFGVSVLLAAGTYIFYQLYNSSVDTVAKIWLTLAIICGISLGIVILVTIFLRKRIYLACQLIEESSKAVTAILSSLLFPVFPWILKIMVLIFAVIVGINLYSLGDPIYKSEMNKEGCICPSTLNYKNNSLCEPNIFNSSVCRYVGNEMPQYSRYFLIYNVIGFIWVTIFVSDLGRMILSSTFATWYWTFRKAEVPFFTITLSIWRTFRYHLGTIAFGSLLITICKVIRAILEVISKKLKQYNNEVANIAIQCCKWNFWLLEHFFKYINYNAYIVCAVHGKGFYYSAKESFSLLMRNIIRVILLNKITDWILTLGKIFIISLSIFSTWWYYTHREGNYLHYWAVPVILVGIGAWMLTSSFFHVQTAAIDTLFICFLEDCERNDGSYEKPYFMSKSLRKVLHR